VVTASYLPNSCWCRTRTARGNFEGLVLARTFVVIRRPYLRVRATQHGVSVLQAKEIRAILKVS
jgi:hypothetical protein